MENEQTVQDLATGNTESATDESVLNPNASGASATPGTEGNGETGTGTQTAVEDSAILNPKTQSESENEFVGAPESYEDFTMPDGFTLDADGKSQISELFRGLNLSQKGGQKLVDVFTERITAQKEADLNALSERRKQWRAAIRQRPNYAAERALAQKGLNAVVSDPEEVALFTDSWMSDHPALFNVFVKVGRLLGEDTPLPSGGAAEDGNSATRRFPIKL